MGTAATPPEQAADMADLLGREQFAGSVLLLLGLMHGVQGLSALTSDGLYADVDYAFAYDLEAWGWGLLVLGVIVVGVGAGLLLDQEWARIVGILVALFSALVGFLLVPRIPVWALMMIALDVAVVRSLTAVIARSRPV